MSMTKAFESLFLSRTDSTFRQLVRYTFVGGLAFLVDFSSLFLLTEYLGVHYLVSAAVAFLLGLCTNYLLSVSWVFANRKVDNRLLEFVGFAAIGMVGLVCNEVFIWFFTEVARLHYLASKCIATVIVYLWNFFARKKMLF